MSPVQHAEHPHDARSTLCERRVQGQADAEMLCRTNIARGVPPACIRACCRALRSRARPALRFSNIMSCALRAVI
eukprot:11764430-Alexandrium_andersonii.AAC.1